MKRITLVALLQLITSLALASASFSEIPLDQLGLPSNFEAWSYTRTNSCVGNNKKIVTTLFGKFEPESQNVSVIAVTTVDKELLYVGYVSGSIKGPTLFNQYLPSMSGAKIYNGLDFKENENLEELLSKRTLAVLGMTKEEVSRLFMLAENCFPVFYQINDLVIDIFRKELK